MLLDITFNLTQLEITGTQIITWIVNTIAFLAGSSILVIPIKRYIKKRDIEIAEKKIRDERIYIEVKSLGNAIKATPIIIGNGVFTNAYNTLKIEMEKESLILNPIKIDD